MNPLLASFVDGLGGDGTNELATEVQLLVKEETERQPKDVTLSNRELAQYIRLVRWIRAHPWALPVAGVALLGGAFVLGRASR